MLNKCGKFEKSAPGLGIDHIILYNIITQQKLIVIEHCNIIIIIIFIYGNKIK